MAKKKKQPNAQAQPPQQAQPIQTASSHAGGHENASALSKGLTRGNTAGMANIFDTLLGSDLEVLKNFSEQHKQLVGVLKSMYGDDMILDAGRKTVWGKPMLAFGVMLHAWNNASVFVRLDVELPPEYPKVGPIVRMVELDPDTDDLTQNLKSIIKRITETEQGDEMMVASILAESEQQLTDVAAEQARRAQGISLEQERATTETAAQADATSKQQLALQQQEAEAAAREAKLIQDVEQHRRRRQLLSSTEPDPDHLTTSGEEYPQGCIVFNRDITCRDYSLDADLTFRAVQPMAVIYERDNKKVLLAVPYRKGDVLALQLVLKEFRLPPGMDSEAEYRSMLAKIEAALQEAKTFEHQAIVKIHDYKLSQVLGSDKMLHWELFILSEYAQNSLTGLLDMVGGINAVKIRIYTRSILDALEFYDRKGYVHPAIHAHNILLFGSKHSSYRAKLSDGYGTALQAFVQRAQGQSELSQGNWIAPELTSDPPARSNKTCIWELGVVLLQMALGTDVTKTYTSPEDALYRAELDQDFDHLISKMCAISARKRPTAFQLQSHHFFKSHTRSIFQAENSKLHGIPSLTRSKSVYESRWASEWEAVEKLGKGGFGVVVKARNRMDGHFYAVKQLKCKSVKDTEEIWGEVRMLAQLNHPGIVRYFGAWSEEEHQDTTDTEASTVPTDQRSFTSPTDSIAPRSSLFALPSTGHDFMDPALSQIPNVEDEEEDEEEESDSSDDGNLFGYQSPPSDNGDSQAIESGDDADEDPSDPFQLQAVLDNFDDGANFFESDGTPEPARTHIPSRPTPFVAAGGTPSAVRRPPQYYNRPSTLYIQMELCETGTLLDLIKNGLPDKIDEAWRIFRLLLDGLEHIHALKVVHRDLKPMNIFIDSQKMPKIGDFGLASPSQATFDGHKVATHVAGPLSRGIGTLFYIAPELDEKTSTGKYSAKADMFALGVIFFEMCFPFTTSAERVKWLQSINRDATNLPSRFSQEQYRVQGRIIQSLLDRDPDRRPSAKDLLLDPEIPEPLEEEKEQRFVQRLMHGDSGQFERVMKNLMSKTATRPQLLAYATTEPSKFEQPDRYLLDAIQQRLAEVFRMHGAVAHHRETVFPVEGLYHNPVKFVDEAGFTVQLPYDLTVPFARDIAVRMPKYSKSFCIGTVFRHRDAGVEPISIPEVDFDLVSNSAQDLSFYDAQVISVLDDCLAKVGSLFLRSFSIIISHGDLLDLILRACEVPETRFDAVKRVLSNLNVGKYTWKQMQQDLQAPAVGLTATAVSALGSFNFMSNIDETRQSVLKSLSKLKKDDSVIKATRTLNRLQEVNEHLTRLRVQTTVLFSPLSNTSETLYRGSIMFKCVETRSSKTIAVGGRYDALIRSYQTPNHKTSARASGFRINVIDLASYTRSDAQMPGTRSAKTKPTIPASIPPRIDVLVTSFDANTLRTTCMEVLRTILEAGLRAELTDFFSTMDELESAYADMSKYWVVIVRSLGPTQRSIKVRSFPDRDENDVPASELVSYLQSELGSTQPTLSEPVLRRTRSSHGASDRENVTVLTPQHKSKKVNRAAIIDSARTAAQELVENMSKAFKILAIDTDDDTLQRMRNTRLSDSESWRSLKHGVALTEREYIAEIQETLNDWSKEGGHGGAFVCNYKTRSCIFYDFGKN